MAEDVQTRIRSVMEDPSALAIARTYAAAFLNSAGTGTGDALEEFTSFVDDVLEQNPGFQAILLSDFVGKDEKLGLIERVVGPLGSQQFTNFLRVLARHERLDLLPLILRESWIQNEHQQGQRRVQVRTAVELDDAALERVRSQIAERFDFEPILVPSVDSNLIGGIVIQIGDTVYDNSLRTQMKALREQFRQRSLYEIQSGRDRFSHPERD